jgi:hypothetical protein
LEATAVLKKKIKNSKKNERGKENLAIGGGDSEIKNGDL